MVNPAIDPTLGITPFQPFVFDDRPQNQWRLLPAPPRTKGGDVPNYQDHELIIFDLGGGLNKTRGRIFPHYLGVDLGDSNKTSSANGIDVSYPSQAILNTFLQSEAVWPNSLPYATCYIYDTLFIGSGSTANQALYRENTTAVGLTPVTLSPAGNIVSLTALQFDSLAPKLTVGVINGQAFTLASNLSTTVSMNSTATLWGGIISPLGATSATNLIYGSTGASSTDAAIATIPVSSAASTVSADTGTRFNSGGYAVGIANVPVTPGNLVPRAVWVVPRTPAPSGMFATSALPPHADIIHTNLYGTDPQYLLTNLPWVTWCVINAGILYYTDGFTWMKNDGTETDLGWVFDREQDSDYKYFSAGGGFARGQLINQVNRLNLTTAASSQIWLEKLDSSDKTRSRWFQVSKVVGPNPNVSPVVNTDLGPGYIDRQIVSLPINGLGYSLKSQCIYLPMYSGAGGLAQDYYQFIGPAGYSHFYNYRYTAGSTKAGQKMEATGTWDSPELAFPFPLKGLPTVIIGMGIYGDLNAGGTGGSSVLSSVKLEQFTQGIGGKLTYSSTSRVSHTVGYRDGLRHEQRWKSFIDEDGNINAPVDPFNLFKYRMTITQDDSRTDWTPNALPIVFHFRTYTNGRVD